ncbi:MAG: DUF308 domain-containing protein [Clostridia bacterium]|nr:DUF308 domain-containing protein [Clostridia bacterium]
MKSFITGMFKNKIVAGVMLLALGGLLLFTPTQAIQTCIRLLGVVFAIGAAVGFAMYFLSKNERRPIFTLILSILAALTAVVFVAAPKVISGILPFFFGVVLIVSSASDLLASLSLPIGKILGMLLSFAGLILGVIIVCNPNALTNFITRLIGISLIFDGAVSIATAVMIKKNA